MESISRWSSSGWNVHTDPSCGLICHYIRSIRVHVVAEAGESWVRLCSRANLAHEEADDGYDITGDELVKPHHLNTFRRELFT
jgi:hypothetical protein